MGSPDKGRAIRHSRGGDTLSVLKRCTHRGDAWKAGGPRGEDKGREDGRGEGRERCVRVQRRSKAILEKGDKGWGVKAE